MMHITLSQLEEARHKRFGSTVRKTKIKNNVKMYDFLKMIIFGGKLSNVLYDQVMQ